MKTCLSNNDFLAELSETELVATNGGETAWYWISYGAGVITREVNEFAIDAYIFIQKNRPMAI